MKIAIVGCGKLGSAFAEGLKVRGHELHLVQKNVSKIDSLKKLTHQVKSSIDSSIKESELVIIAVKPQDFDKTAQELTPLLHAETTALSVMAGVSTTRLCAALPSTSQIIRSMPNLPAQVGRAISAVYYPKATTPASKERAQTALEAVGEVLELQSEELMNAATAIAGSGPGYLYAFASALEKAAVELGFNNEDAAKLVKATFTGAGALWEKTTDSAETLQEKVRSKGGTTDAGLKVFDAAKLQKIVSEAAHAAYKRAKEL